MSPDDLYKTLLQRAGFEALTKVNNDKQFRIVGRVREQNVPQWLATVERLLLQSERSTWKADISKQYFMDSNKLRYGWRVILQGDDINSSLGEIVGLLRSVPTAVASAVETDAVPLHGNPNRNTLNANGRGAQPMAGAKILATQRR